MSTNKKHEAKAHEKEVVAHKNSMAHAPMVFGRMNYILSLVALAVLVVGFLIMSGSKGDIYDFRRITLAPIIVLVGFIIGFFAIFWKPKNTGTQHTAE